MSNETVFITAVFAAFLAGWLLGLVQGNDNGAQRLHMGEMACQTLPDATVYCWAVKK